MTKRLIWEPFRDPIKELQQDSEVIFDESEDEEAIVLEKNIRPHLLTPHGLIELTDVRPLKQNRWVGTTNFNIDKRTVEILNKVPGIQGLIVQSRYEIIITIGRLFKTSEVMDSIHKALGVNFDRPENLDSIPKDSIRNLQEKIRELKSAHDHWCVYLCPNGKFYFFGSSSESEMLQYLTEYKDAQSSVGGAVYSSCLPFLELS